jgi:tyrosine-protein phosphatase YwqE
MKKITTKTAEISYDSLSRLLRVKILPGAEIELDDAIQNFKATKMLTNNDNYLVLVDGRVSLSVSREARNFASQIKADEGRIAEAFLITSTANKLLGNFYINVNKPVVPTKIFSSDEKALEWLESFLYKTEDYDRTLASVYINK